MALFKDSGLMLRRSLLRGLSASGAALVAAPWLNAGTSNAISGEDKATNWQGWRGPDRTGLVDGTAWPTSLDESHLTVAWTQSMGDSYSGPICTNDLVFTTESKSGKESAMALTLATGENVWTQTWKGAHNVPFFAARNGNWIRATPVTDGTKLYIGGIRDVLCAFDVKTGQEIWRIDFAAKFGKVPDFGMVCSPIIEDGFLYIQAGKGVHKVNCETSEIAWSSMQDSGDIMSSGAFSSPIIGEINGVRQLIVQSRTTLAGLDRETGAILWSTPIEAFRGMNILTPTIWNNQLFTSSYGGKSVLIDVSDLKNPKPVWENKLEGYMSSPIVIGQYLYMHLRNKRFACLDLSNGKEAWVTKPFGEYWSMVSDGKSILALDQTGDLRLIAHNPEKFDLISERKLTDEEAWAHLAVLNNRVIVRSQKALTLYNWT
jgi:outer membrane protein assembly factor BamB